MATMPQRGGRSAGRYEAERILRRWSVLPQRLLGLREVLLAMGLLGQRLPLIGLVLPGQLSLPLARI